MSEGKGFVGGSRVPRAPWPAMLLTLIALVSMTAAAAIVVISNNKPAASWTISPAVLLAFFSSIWSGSLTMLLTMSIAVIWWRAASHGSSLESLHCIWNKGLGLKYISTLRSNAAACWAVLLSWLVIVAQVAHNPLLQRSTSTTIRQTTTSDDLTLSIAPKIPDGWIGSVQNAATGTIITYPNSTSAIRGWWLNSPIQSPGSQCDGTCQGRVRGSGIDYSCYSTTSKLDLTTLENEGSFVFGINTMVTSNSTGSPVLNLSTLSSSSVDENCTATLISWNCNIQAATVEFPFIVNNNTISLDAENLYPPVVVETYVSDGDKSTATQGQGAGPLLGLHDFVTDVLATNVSLVIDQTRNISLHTGLLISDLFYQFNNSAYNPAAISKCRLEWVDPTQYVLTAMQDYLFRSSISVYTNENSQNCPVKRTSSVLTFQSNFRFLIGALSLMTLAIICVLVQFWNWWELGRRVTLSPIEVVNAFGALPTSQLNDVCMVDEILKVTGKTTVRYDGMRFNENSTVLQSRLPMRIGDMQDARRKCSKF
ncbi:hypothetical protein BGW36DRAFT_297717 [Talaromyces proteolyticus]|uniref:Uncharacterized protein n=1 Tax=Talaromyces proteolyticus TaxID=1131652 RepID=A0AAD4KQS6_9EURO|nr:uncharacterized protein BGW36DRAFT_297717 [Talaromyces proteolyticus]KAH8696242.1 hypothetical protein BGW36DRAFT_297717 [Talaromyces proteolyticus]